MKNLKIEAIVLVRFPFASSKTNDCVYARELFKYACTGTRRKQEGSEREFLTKCVLCVRSANRMNRKVKRMKLAMLASLRCSQLLLASTTPKSVWDLATMMSMQLRKL